MAWFESFLAGLPTTWAVAALVLIIGGSVVILRGIIRFALRTVMIGVIGVALLGVLYYLINFTAFL